MLTKSGLLMASALSAATALAVVATPVAAQEVSWARAKSTDDVIVTSKCWWPG